MGSSNYVKKKYSADNGTYERFLNKEGKPSGIKRAIVEVDRNDKCLCASGKKYKNCCMPKGIFWKQKQRKVKQSKLFVLKMRMKLLFNKR